MFTSEMEREITWEQALNEAKTDITGVVYGGDYDNFSEEESAYTEGVQAAQWHFQSVIKALQKTYAPTIIMTQNQKNAFDLAKQTLETSELANVVEGQGPAYSKLDELSGRVWGHKQGEATDAQIKKTMQAWLHPDLITVI